MLAGMAKTKNSVKHQMEIIKMNLFIYLQMFFRLSFLVMSELIRLSLIKATIHEILNA